MNQIDRIMELADQYHEDAAEDIRMCYDQIPSQRSENTRQALLDTIEQALAPVEPNWVELNKQADQIVRSKPVWGKYINGTPLENDIACWMADFALAQYSIQKNEPEPVEEECNLREHDESA